MDPWAFHRAMQVFLAATIASLEWTVFALVFAVWMVVAAGLAVMLPGHWSLIVLIAALVVASVAAVWLFHRTLGQLRNVARRDIPPE